MKYEDLKNIKEAINTFDDANFVSLLDESTIIVQNEKSLWTLPFSTNPLVFHGESAELIEKEEEESESEGESLVELSKRILTSLQESDSHPLIDEELRLSIVEACSYKKKKQKKEKEMNEDFSSPLFSTLSEEAQDFSKNFQESWAPKMQKIRENFLEFYSQGSLFENGEIKKRDILDPRVVLENFEKKKEVSETLLESAESISNWKKRALELGILEESLNGINPLTDWTSGLTKNLIIQKKNGSEINVHETIKELKKVVVESADVQLSLASSNVPGSSNGLDKLSFLKMNGVFTKEDLSKLVQDFSKALGHFNNLSQEQVQMISSMKDKIDYMFRTDMVDDEEVASTINDFNKEFGHDSRDVYRDPEASSGMRMGIAMGAPAVVTPIATAAVA